MYIPRSISSPGPPSSYSSKSEIGSVMEFGFHLLVDLVARRGQSVNLRCTHNLMLFPGGGGKPRGRDGRHTWRLLLPGWLALHLISWSFFQSPAIRESW